MYPGAEKMLWLVKYWTFVTFGEAAVGLTFSDFHAWFFVYSASTSSGVSLDRRTRGSRSGLVLSKTQNSLTGGAMLNIPMQTYKVRYNRNCMICMRVPKADLEPLKNPLESFFFHGHCAADLQEHYKRVKHQHVAGQRLCLPRVEKEAEHVWYIYLWWD